MPTALDAIVTDLKGSDRQERIDLLLDFAKSLPPLPDRLAAHKDASHRVEECQSPVYLFVELDGRPGLAVRRRPDRGPDGARVRLAAARGAGGATVEDILRVPSDLVDRCGLAEILGMLRVRGLSGVLRRVKADVTRAADRRSADLGIEAETRDTPRHVIVRQGRALAPSCRPAARNSPRSTAGRSPSSTSTAPSTPSTTSAPTTAARWPRASYGLRDPVPAPRCRFDVRTGRAALHAGHRAGGRPCRPRCAATTFTWLSTTDD